MKLYVRLDLFPPGRDNDERNAASSHLAAAAAAAAAGAENNRHNSQNPHICLGAGVRQTSPFSSIRAPSHLRSRAYVPVTRYVHVHVHVRVRGAGGEQLDVGFVPVPHCGAIFPLPVLALGKKGPGGSCSVVCK